jgi:hypothetical protein
LLIDLRTVFPAQDLEIVGIFEGLNQKPDEA